VWAYDKREAQKTQKTQKAQKAQNPQWGTSPVRKTNLVAGSAWNITNSGICILLLHVVCLAQHPPIHHVFLHRNHFAIICTARQAARSEWLFISVSPQTLSDVLVHNNKDEASSYGCSHCIEPPIFSLFNPKSFQCYGNSMSHRCESPDFSHLERPHFYQRHFQ
jgi:hypothetical protein